MSKTISINTIYNYRTEKNEYVSLPITDWEDYIPQGQEAQSLYNLYQEIGDTPTEAAKKVLLICVGTRAND